AARHQAIDKRAGDGRRRTRSRTLALLIRVSRRGVDAPEFLAVVGAQTDDVIAVAALGHRDEPIARDGQRRVTAAEGDLPERLRRLLRPVEMQAGFGGEAV